MAQGNFQRTLVSSIADGPALTDSTTATSILLAANKKILPPNFFYTGKMLRVTGCARVSNVVTTPGTLTLDLRLNSTPIVVANGVAMQMSTTAHTTLPLWFQFLLTCRAVGSGTSANLMAQGIALSQCLAVSGADVTVHGGIIMPNATPAVGTGFDSTVANVLDCFAKFSVNTSTTSIQLHQWLVEDLN